MSQATKRLSDIERAHQGLIARITEAVPNNITGYQAENEDVEARAQHLAYILSAVETYARAVMKDTQQVTCVNLDTSPLDTIHDCIGDLVGELKASACLREDA